MNTKTLIRLIENEFERSNDISEIKENIIRLIDLYEKDVPLYESFNFLNNQPEEVPYSSICGCNPINGGSGVCGCTLGNTMVKNPKTYGCGFWINNSKNT